jgi:hypothetical protein
MSEINFYAGTTGDDPELDTLRIRLHTESACRTGGALALRPRDLNRDQCLVYLREKEGAARWQPVSRTLMNALLEHAEQRGAASDRNSQLLRYRNGKPITDRRYNHLWDRLGRYLPLGHHAQRVRPLDPTRHPHRRRHRTLRLIGEPHPLVA